MEQRQQGRAVIVGAGIGGLAAAIGLHRAGWRVRVLERSAAPGDVGAGISLWSNALRALEALGAGQAIRERGTMRGSGGVRTPAGRWLLRSSGQAVLDAAGVSLLLVHRGDLHRELRAALPSGAVVTGATAEAVEGAVEEGGDAVAVRYTTACGARRTAGGDVVVAADGIHSGTRGQLWPASAGPRYAGFTAWRGVTDGRFDLEHQSETWGRGAEFGLTQLLDGRVYWFATRNADAGVRLDDERAEVLRRFGGWHAPIGEVVRATAPGAVLRHDIYHLPHPLPAFARDRVALLGDAAHAMTPNLGQGGCLALEDAVVLSAELATGAPVREALRRYDLARRPRTERLARLSARMSRVVQADNPAAVALRSALVAAVPVTLSAAGMARPLDWHPPAPRGGRRADGATYSGDRK